jgi:hypothetical protein
VADLLARLSVLLIVSVYNGDDLLELEDPRLLAVPRLPVSLRCPRHLRFPVVLRAKDRVDRDEYLRLVPKQNGAVKLASRRQVHSSPRAMTLETANQ